MTTRRVLKLGGLEGNAFVAPWAHQTTRLILFKASGILLICAVAFLIARMDRAVFLAVMFLHHGLMFGTVWSNGDHCRDLGRKGYRWLYRRSPDGEELVGRLYLRTGRADHGEISGRLADTPPAAGAMVEGKR
jgi:hypothetical protein